MLLIYNTYQRLKALEKEHKTKILYKSKYLKYPKLYIQKYNDEVYYYMLAKPDKLSDIPYGTIWYEPFLISGDAIGFTVIKGTITEEVDKIFEEEKRKLNIPYEFHKANAYYETDDYRMGKELYYRGYCVQALEAMHKNYKYSKQVKKCLDLKKIRHKV